MSYIIKKMANVIVNIFVTFGSVNKQKQEALSDVSSSQITGLKFAN